MQDKKVSVRLGLSLLSVAILVPLISSVNHFAKISKEPIKSRSLQADGAPIPPLPPPTKSLVADGAPIPPLPPPTGMGALVADGAPIPPLPPPKNADNFSTTLVADGAPIPPLPPPKGSRGLSIQPSA
jgi:hypothetical protein